MADNFEKLKGAVLADLEQFAKELVGANETPAMLRAQGAARALFSLKDKIELIEKGKFDEIQEED